ncbi:MAG: methyltransferase domain-containing protein [Deltaproteobacteria bacterium]|nr:MAG: methyltransferase domain-containing protein [Deltaproteobacteria bacterium]
MTDPQPELQALFANPRFPRSGAYDARWVAENQMGPNALWLTEWACEALDLVPGMRVLDLGCGRALSSVYLAREHGVHVYATDLWIPAGDNWARARAAGVADRVTPIHAEAHALPFAEGFFDAIISLDAYTYFGTDDLYLSYITRYLRPGGHLAVVMPGLTHELDGPPPAHLTEPQANGATFWEPDCLVFHSADWWRRHWERAGQVEVASVEALADGWRHWADHERAVEASGLGVFPSMEEALRTDAGATIGFVRAVARRPDADAPSAVAPHVWEPAFMGVAAELLAKRDAPETP